MVLPAKDRGKCEERDSNRDKPCTGLAEDGGECLNRQGRTDIQLLIAIGAVRVKLEYISIRIPPCTGQMPVGNGTTFRWMRSHI